MNLPETPPTTLLLSFPDPYVDPLGNKLLALLLSLDPWLKDYKPILAHLPYWNSILTLAQSTKAWKLTDHFPILKSLLLMHTNLNARLTGLKGTTQAGMIGA